MRNSAILSALFPATRRSLLSATLVQPNKWWYLSELAQHLGTTPSSLQRELSSLVDAGLLQKRREGTRTYFKAETRSPLYPELASVFEKTVGVIPALQRDTWNRSATRLLVPSFTALWHGEKSTP